MQIPYTPSPAEALTIAQTSLAAALSAVVWHRPIRPWVGSFLWISAVWLAAIVPVEPQLYARFFSPVAYGHTMMLLQYATLLASAAVVIARPGRLVIPVLMGGAVLAFARDYLRQSDLEIAGAHLLWFGALLGAHYDAEASPPAAAAATAPASPLRQELLLAAMATALAALVGVVVLRKSCDSADEWAYTFQALLFSHGKAYGTVPPCGPSFQSFWVFPYQGRTFSQYTPGWPLFMAPFARAGVPWLAACVTHGLLVVGVARLARRCAGSLASASREVVAASGVAGALVVMFGTTVLINAGSRFPHVFVAALFAWAIEASCELTTRGVTPKAQQWWGVALGTAAGLLLATRPADGATLGVGLAAYALYAAVVGRFAWRGLLASAIAFALWAGLALVLLRLQLGEWFKTGYSITEQIHFWAKFKMSVPQPHEFKFGIPLATGAYCWWPCAPALGAAGLWMVRGGERRVVFMLLSGGLAMVAFYTMVEFGRGVDFGYGPRYALPLVVPMAVGSGVLLGPVFAGALSGRGMGPAILIAVAMTSGFLRLAPLLFPATTEDVRARNVVFDAARRLDLRHAVVIIANGSTISQGYDLTQNSPVDPNPEVLFAREAGPEQVACLRAQYPDRQFYRTVGGDPLVITPE